MLTTRDMEVIEFVKAYKVANTDTIAQLFFPSLSACQKRLKVIYDNKKLHRIRDNISCSYIYFNKMPKQFKHSLCVTNFYRELSSRCTVHKFNIEPVMGEIRPDAAFVYTYNGVTRVGVLEVELSKKGFNWVKYHKFINCEEYRAYMTAPPVIYAVGNSIKPSMYDIENLIIDTNFKGMRVW